MSPAAPRRGPAGRPAGGRPAAGRSRGARRAGAWRVRAGLLGLLLAGLLVAGTGPAGAHPLGNFTVSSSSGLRVGPDRLEVDHVVDMAEIPAFQTRQAIDADHDGKVGAAEAAAWRDRECPRLAGGLRATVDEQPLALAVTGPGSPSLKAPAAWPRSAWSAP